MPLTRLKRPATMALHWSLLFLVTPLGAGWITPILEWGFAIVALGMSALALAFGLQAYAGPKSPRIVRLINAWGHRGLYVYLAVVGALGLHGLVTGGGVNMVIHYQVLLWITIFHAIYHLFRHLVVGDGALRTMTPRSIHRML
jgi:superoxide oxidase